MLFRTTKPILGYKAVGHTTPADSVIELDPESPEAKRFLESGTIIPAPLSGLPPFTGESEGGLPAESAVPDDGGYATDMTSTEPAVNMVNPKPKSRKSKA